VAAFNRALNLAREFEEPLAEGLANVGLARILLRRGLWDEAAVIHQEALTRFRTADAPAAQALALLGIGEARHRLDEMDASREAYAQAQRLFAAVGNPLGEAAALAGEAESLLDALEIEAALGRFARAIALVEQVGAALARSADRESFFDRYATLYTGAIRAAAYERDSARVLELARAYASRASHAGRARAVQRLREYEQQLPLRGAGLTKDQIEQNKAIARLLADARKVLAA
jgi:hypothetical protein